MYETIMSLPLFHGVGSEQVSRFLEKTHLKFSYFRAGDVVVEKGSSCTSLKFIISGEARIDHCYAGTDICISETVPAGTVFGADRLFGLHTEFMAEAVALTDLCLMEFGKEQYMELLKTDRIYMMNFLNYLSVRSQRPAYAIEKYGTGNFISVLAVWLTLFTDSRSESVILRGSVGALSSATSIPGTRIRRDIARMVNRGIATKKGDTLYLNSRRSLLDTVPEMLDEREE